MIVCGNAYGNCHLYYSREERFQPKGDVHEETDAWIDWVVTARIRKSRPDLVAILLKSPLSKQLPSAADAE